MKLGITSLATKRTRRTLRTMTRRTPRMMTAVTQNSFSDNRKCLPLNLVKDSSAQWKVFARLENPLHFTDLFEMRFFLALEWLLKKVSAHHLSVCVALYTANWSPKLTRFRPFTETGFRLFSSASLEPKCEISRHYSNALLNRKHHEMIDCLISISYWVTTTITVLFLCAPKVSRQFLRDHLLHVFYAHSLKLNKLTIAIRRANWTASRRVLRVL